VRWIQQVLLHDFPLACLVIVIRNYERGEEMYSSASGIGLSRASLVVVFLVRAILFLLVKAGCLDIMPFPLATDGRLGCLHHLKTPEGLQSFLEQPQLLHLLLPAEQLRQLGLLRLYEIEHLHIHGECKCRHGAWMMLVGMNMTMELMMSRNKKTWRDHVDFYAICTGSCRFRLPTLSESSSRSAPLRAPALTRRPAPSTS